MATKEDYYSVLEISKTATTDEIKKAYRKKAMQYHPDKNPGDKSAEEKFKQANEAYEVLNDPQKKRMYDQVGHSAFNQAGGGGHTGGFSAEDIFGSGGFEDIFSSFFGGGGSGRGSSRTARGDSLLVRVSVSLQEAFQGVKKDIYISRDEHCGACNGLGASSKSDIVRCSKCAGRGEISIQQGFFSVRQTCPSCQGAGEVTKNPCRSCRGEGVQAVKRELAVSIPAGVATGVRLKMSNEGSAAKNGARGDLYIEVEVSNNPKFKREGDDLFIEKTTSFKQMVLGGKISIENISGSEVVITLPEGTENGQIFKVKGQGMPVLGASARKGDMFVTIYTEIPRKISHKAKELLEELDNLM